MKTNIGVLRNWKGTVMKKLVVALALLATPAMAQEYRVGGADWNGPPPAYQPPAPQQVYAPPSPPQAWPAVSQAPAPVREVTFTPRKVWDSYVPTTYRFIHRTLLVGSDGTYRVVAMDHDAAGNSNGGSTCSFNAAGSDCVGNNGEHYQLKPQSIRWFMSIANGAEPY
jgi:hypothetical protein